MLAFYAQFIFPGDIVFDIGANIGNRTEIFLKLGAIVVAIEPQNLCMNLLNKKYGCHKNFNLVGAAVGEKEGVSEMFISNANTLSSLSPDWINAVKKSGRFAKYRWDKTVLVPMTTIDAVIAQYGMPLFIKIDVEGFEYQVLQGLTSPIKMISLEFTPEILVKTFLCIDYLDRLGSVKANYCIGESFCWELDDWISPEELKDRLRNLPDTKVFGDVYIRMY